MDSLKQETAHQPAEPPVDRLPRTEMHRQHLPAAARAHQIAHRIDDLMQVHPSAPATACRFGHQRGDPLPFLVRQARRIALGLSGDVGHPATGLLRPHPKLESQNLANKRYKCYLV